MFYNLLLMFHKFLKSKRTLALKTTSSIRDGYAGPKRVTNSDSLLCFYFQIFTNIITVNLLPIQDTLSLSSMAFAAQENILERKNNVSPNVYIYNIYIYIYFWILYLALRFLEKRVLRRNF